LSERDHKGEDTRALLGKTFIAILLIGVVAFLFAALWSRPLIALLTTPQYLSTAMRPGSDTALRLVSIPFLLNGVILYSFYVLLNRHVWKRLTLSLFFAAVVSLSLNFILIPIHGFVGAAYTSIVVHVLLAAMLLPQALKEMPMRLDRNLIRQLALFGLILGLGLSLFRPILVNELSTVIGLIAMTVLMGTLAWTLRLHKSLL
jgi:O-antigen/teichoic acid export membrane protein